MKIQICSDLHMHPNRSIFDYIKKTDADTIVIAGDIGPIPLAIKAIKEAMTFYYRVIFVAGNHEFYGFAVEDVLLIKQAFEYNSTVYILDNDLVKLDNGMTVFGGAMWADLSEATYVEMSNIKCSINDFDHINDFTAEKCQQLYYKFCEAYEPDVDIIITHNGPSSKSIAAKYINDALNNYFVNSFLEKNECNAKLWVHGHCHNFSDYIAGNTRVICNPTGYSHEGSKAIRDFVVEL